MTPPTTSLSYQSKPLIVDADAVIALFHPQDALAARASAVLDHCIRDDAILLYLVTAIIDAITTLQRRLRRPHLAAQVAALVQDAQWPVAPVDEQTLATAITLFDPQGSKQNTLFDAVVAAMAKRHKADAIFSFDRWYEKAGFRLAVTLFNELDIDIQEGGSAA